MGSACGAAVSLGRSNVGCLQGSSVNPTLIGFTPGEDQARLNRHQDQFVLVVPPYHERSSDHAGGPCEHQLTIIVMDEVILWRPRAYTIGILRSQGKTPGGSHRDTELTTNRG